VEVAGASPAADINSFTQDCGVTSSISACEADGPGANPGFLTIIIARCVIVRAFTFRSYKTSTDSNLAFMKHKPKNGIYELQLVISWGNSYYIEWVANLEKILRRKPKTVRVSIVGDGGVPPDAALIIRAAFLARAPKTRIIMNARSSLQGGSVMLWLMGDTRVIRDDAKVYFRPAELPDEIEVDPNGEWKAETKYADSFSDFDPEEGDYARVLQIIDEYLPMKEFAGRLIGVSVLKQFGLVENESVDGFLANAFAKTPIDALFR
jgi:hypothetical protein